MSAVRCAAAAPFITCLAAACEWKDHFPLSFKRCIVREFNSQATDELEAPSCPTPTPRALLSTWLSVCFVQQTPNRWAFVLTHPPTPSHLLTRPAIPTPPQIASSCAVTMWHRELIQPYLHYLRSTSAGRSLVCVCARVRVLRVC